MGQGIPAGTPAGTPQPSRARHIYKDGEIPGTPPGTRQDGSRGQEHRQGTTPPHTQKPSTKTPLGDSGDTGDSTL